jgi:glutamate N-acetyltransferase / amino-acid N-acetyltransferase
LLTVKKETSIKKVSEGTITTPKGFKAAGIHAGLKYKRKDLGIIMSEIPATCAAVYTLSHFQAPPLKVTKESIKKAGKIQALFVNSAVANACTGDQGIRDAYEMRKLASQNFAVPEHFVAVASTGVIGELLPMKKIRNGVEKLQPTNCEKGALAFNQAILTTDTCVKQTCYELEIDGKRVFIAGSAKGSGMIHPNMATMLGFITTDANVDQQSLQKALSQVTDDTYNCITVDGETSTNDMVTVMANGLAHNVELQQEHPQWDEFVTALKMVSEDLAKMIARDGEGATKLIEVEVTGAETAEDAKVTAKKIVGSDLVKTAVYGADANWGRIIGAIGHSDVKIDPGNVDISICSTLILKGSEPYTFNEEEVTELLKKEKVTITVSLNVGEEKGKAWGCDLTYDYVKINASYRT